MPRLAEVAGSIQLAAAAIPAGRVSTYGDIGRVVGCGPRLVARVLATSGGETCWWRVVRADGRLPAHLIAQASRLLAAEGVGTTSGRVDLVKYRAELD